MAESQKKIDRILTNKCHKVKLLLVPTMRERVAILQAQFVYVALSDTAVCPQVKIMNERGIGLAG